MANIEQLRKEIDEQIAINKRLLERPTTPEQRREVRTAARETTERMSQTPGRFGLVGPEARARTRVGIEELGPVSQFAAEATPGTLGSILGGAAGTAVAPGIGTVVGAGLGGLAGEALGQEAGVTPESDVGLAIAGGAPVVGGALVAPALKGARMVGGTLARNFPQVRQAAGEVARQDAEKLVATLGNELFTRQPGLAGSSTETLLSTLRTISPGTAKLPGELLVNTKRAVKGLPDDDPAKIFMQSAEVSDFDDLLAMREALMNTAFQVQDKPSREVARKALKGLDRDLDDMLNVRPGPGDVRVAQALVKRGRLELALQDMDHAVMRNTKPVEGSEDLIETNISAVRNWFFGKTNPRHPEFDADFTKGMGPITEDINKFLTGLEKISARGKIGGPGSLIIQGRAAAGGAILGSALLGPVGAGAGAVAATSLPRAFVRTLASPRGRGYLRTIARLGQGRIASDRWATLMEITAQGLQSSRRQLTEDER